MRRLILLVVLIGGTCAGMIAIVVSVASSGDQFVRRLESHWALGTLVVEGPHMVDLDTVAFDAFRIRANPTLESQYFLLFRDLQWQRPNFFPKQEALDLVRAKLRFDAGQMNLERRDGLGWNVGKLNRSISAGSENSWMERIPAEIIGKALAVKVRRSSSVHPALVDFRAESIEVRREESGVEIRCQILADPWRDGELRGSLTENGARWDVDVRGVALERFPFADLARLFQFPWPVGMPTPTGRAEICWDRDRDTNLVEIVHSLAGIEVESLAHPLRYLSGRATFTPTRGTWQLDEGTYSHSALTGHLEADLTKRHIAGSFTLDGVLEDSTLGEGLPGIWSAFVKTLAFAGGGKLTIDLAGDSRLPPIELIEKLHLELDGARLEGPDREGVNGDFTLTPSPEGWTLAGSTKESVAGGFGIPASDWQGRVKRTGLRLRRSGEMGPQCRIEILTASDKAVRFRVEASRVPLSTLLRQPLGDGEATLIISGDWTPENGLRWRDGWLSWSGMKMHRDVSWPRRLPSGLLSGTIGFRRYRGQTSIPAILVRDDRGLWVARGEVRADGTWELEGTLVDGTTALYSADAVPRILEQRGSDDPDPERFRIEGRLFDWRVRG